MPNQPSDHHIQDFIFGRELSEIYLLLDHISGRADKSFTQTKNHQADPEKLKEIERICQIGWPWPPRPEPEKQASDAATLIKAKDWLNAAARPATGASIAFTLMVVGDDVDEYRQATPGWWQRLWKWLRHAPETPAASVATPTQSVMGMPPKESWPTRLSLATRAFPGLASSARQYERRMHRIMWFLIVGLGFTCVLSWYVAIGNDILAHLDSLHTENATALAKKQLLCAPKLVPADGVARTGNAKRLNILASGCDGCGLEIECDAQSPARAELRQLQQQLRRLELDHEAVGDALHDWIKLFPPLFRAHNEPEPGAGADGPTGQNTKGELEVPARQLFTSRSSQGIEETHKSRGNEEALRLLTHVLATSILPMCYGCLGAAVAVVRDLWSKVRESTLSPRDYTLALGQLALGVTIGACISLLYHPAESNAMLAETGTLTSAAISFLAGFGVEAVFSTLENVVRRVFNTPGPSAR